MERDNNYGDTQGHENVAKSVSDDVSFTRLRHS